MLAVFSQVVSDLLETNSRIIKEGKQVRLHRKIRRGLKLISKALLVKPGDPAVLVGEPDLESMLFALDCIQMRILDWLESVEDEESLV